MARVGVRGALRVRAPRRESRACAYAIREGFLGIIRGGLSPTPDRLELVEIVEFSA